jgi:hypothetical protein
VGLVPRPTLLTDALDRTLSQVIRLMIDRNFGPHRTRPADVFLDFPEAVVNDGIVGHLFQ